MKKKMFEDIKHIAENGDEYWEARELQLVLEYKEWRFFQNVIEKAQIACSTRQIIDYRLSRYACYLIVQNGNPKNKNIALGQTYFEIQTRKQELTEQEYGLL